MEPRLCSIELELAAFGLPLRLGGLEPPSAKLCCLAAVVVPEPPTLASSLTSRLYVDWLASLASTAIFCRIICLTCAMVEL